MFVPLRSWDAASSRGRAFREDCWRSALNKNSHQLPADSAKESVPKADSRASPTSRNKTIRELTIAKAVFFGSL